MHAAVLVALFGARSIYYTDKLLRGKMEAEMSERRPQSIELPVRGLDCPDCARHVERALQVVPGVAEVTILLSAQKAVIRFDPARTGPAEIRGPGAARQAKKRQIAPFNHTAHVDRPAPEEHLDDRQGRGWGILPAPSLCAPCFPSSPSPAPPCLMTTISMKSIN